MVLSEPEACLQMARADLATAMESSDPARFREGVWFFWQQQAAEKGLKAWLHQRSHSPGRGGSGVSWWRVQPVGMVKRSPPCHQLRAPAQPARSQDPPVPAGGGGGGGPRRRLGLLAGQCSVPDDFDQIGTGVATGIATEDIAGLFEGLPAAAPDSGGL